MFTAIPDSSVLICLSAIDRMDLIVDLHDSVVVPPAVVREVVEEGAGQPGSEDLRRAIDAGRVRVAEPANRALVAALSATLGDGESEVIALGTEMAGSVAILDDRAARAAARRLGLVQTGLVGVLLRAKRLGRLDSVSRALDRLRDEAGFRLSLEIVSKVLAECGERSGG
jgi:hypothetical protein